jgi:hypothetical protein
VMQLSPDELQMLAYQSSSPLQAEISPSAKSIPATPSIRPARPDSSPLHLHQKPWTSVDKRRFCGDGPLSPPKPCFEAISSSGKKLSGELEHDSDICHGNICILATPNSPSRVEQNWRHHYRRCIATSSCAAQVEWW